MSIGKNSINRAGTAASRATGEQTKRLFSEDNSAEAAQAASSAVLESVTAPDSSSTLEYVPVAAILPSFDEEMITCAATFNDVMKSVSEYGILIPMLLRKVEIKGETVFRVLTGHKRLYAAKKLGIETVPALVIVCDDRRAADICREVCAYDSKSKRFDTENLSNSASIAASLLTSGIPSFDTSEGSSGKLGEDKLLSVNDEMPTFLL